MSIVLSLLIFLPFVGALVAYGSTWLAAPRGESQDLASSPGASQERLTESANTKRYHPAFYVALAFALATLLVSLYSFWYVFANTPLPGNYALTENYSWVRTVSFGLNYLVGLDGLSAPLVFLSALLSVLAIFGSRNQITRHLPAYYALLLFLEGSMMGVFLSLNLIAFYIFWELALIPVFFFIGVWGGDRRKYAVYEIHHLHFRR